MVITTSFGTSLPAALVVNAAAPSILVDLNTNRAIAFNQDGSFNGLDNPARPGSVVTVYLTGQGAVANAPANGTPAAGPSAALLSTSAQVGKAAAVLQYLGLTPGVVGLGQANVVIPALPASEYPLVINVNGMASNWATISVGVKP